MDGRPRRDYRGLQAWVHCLSLDDINTRLNDSVTLIAGIREQIEMNSGALSEREMTTSTLTGVVQVAVHRIADMQSAHSPRVHTMGTRLRLQMDPPLPDGQEETSVQKALLGGQAYTAPPMPDGQWVHKGAESTPRVQRGNVPNTYLSATHRRMTSMQKAQLGVRSTN